MIAEYTESDCLNVIKYAVIGEPIDYGAVHVTVTFVPLITVTGGVGVEGAYAAKTEIVVELVEKP